MSRSFIPWQSRQFQGVAMRTRSMVGTLRRQTLSVRLQSQLPNAFLMLSSLLNVGIGIEEAVGYVERISKNRTAKAYFTEVLAVIQEGQSLWSAYPEVISPWLRTLIRAAEQAGELAFVLQVWSEQTQLEQRWLKQLAKQMVYPAFLLLGTFLTMMVIGNSVLPRFLQMYEQTGLGAPHYVSVMAALYQHLYLTPLIVLVLTLMVWGMCRLLYVYAPHYWQRLRRHLPGHSALRLHRTYRLSFALSLLITAGVPLMDAAMVLSQSKGTSWLAAAARQIAEQVGHGATLSECFEGDWDEMMHLQVVRAELSGDIADALDKTQTFTREQFIQTMAHLTQWIEPMISLSMGVLVGLTVFSLYVPMYSLVSNMGLS